jgi:RHS repeat-associated protein
MAGRLREFMGARCRVWTRTLTTVTAAVAVGALVAPAAVAQQLPQYSYAGEVWSPYRLPGGTSVPVHAVAGNHTAPQLTKGQKPLDQYMAGSPTWPAAGSATVSLTAAGSAAPGTDTTRPAAARSARASSAAGRRAAPTASGTSSGRIASASPAPPAVSASASVAAAGTGPVGSGVSSELSARVVAVSGPVRAGSLPVWVGPVSAGSAAVHSSAEAAGGLPSSVRVQVASHAQSLAAGADGMLLGFARADGASGSGQVQVVVDYASLAKAYGGGFGSRLELVQVPACALTTPQLAACRTRTPVAFTNRAGADQLVATLTLGGTTTASRSGTEPLAARSALTEPMTAAEVISGASGSQGNYAATSLNPSGTWQASGTGAFTYSYPIDVPDVVGGDEPSVAFSYDSQSVDGETSARNSQASWIGDGWDYEPGFIERSYRSCDSLLDSSGNRLLKGSGDECWGGDNATISFGAYSGTLVPVAKPTLSPSNLVQQWALQGDDGTIVQELSGADNDLYQGVYYRVLSPDGSAAYFGADHAPTAAGPSASLQSADPSTNSAWGVPVLHPVAGDPCYSSSTGTASKCSANEGWRWNLDFTVSPTGFVQRYDYSTETNYYDLGGGQVAASNGSGTLTSYTRGGTLSSISYGYTLADEAAGRTPAGQVLFTSKQRCQTSSSFDCSQAISASNATYWPDVPYDQDCPSTDSTTLPPGSTTVPSNVCINSSPTFWTTTRLDSVTTKVDVAGQGLTAVDSYQLGQVYSDAGGSVDPVTGTTVDPADTGELQAVMWLQTITHTGLATDAGGSGAIALNPVTFIGTEIDNRVAGSDPGDPPLYRPRISQIVTEAGEDIAVTYYAPDCSQTNGTMPSAPDTDTMSCYQVYWTPPGAVKPMADWFNKTRVQTVAATDLTGASADKAGVTSGSAYYDGSPTQTSTYTYGPAAWHRDDSALTDDQYRTWDQFRGYATVTVTTGTAPDPVTQTTTTYLQGMDGDYLANGTQRSIKVADSVGDEVTDSDWLAGTALETDTYTAAGGTVDAKTVNGPFTETLTQDVPQTAWTDWNTTDDTGTAPTLSTLPNLQSYRTAATQSRTYSLLSDKTWRENQTLTDDDAQGRPSTVDATADVGGTASKETCTTTGYATAPSVNTMMLDYADQTTTVTGACGGSNPILLSAKRTYYGGDGTLTSLGTFGQLDAAGTGEVTGTQIATAYSGGSPTAWQTTSAMTYDGAGRITRTLDANGNPTGTAYTPAWSTAGGNTNPTTIVSTNSQHWTTTSVLDPLRGLATENTDANNRKTDITYDALGRRTAVWLPGRVAPGSSPESAYPSYPDEKFSYSIDPGANTTITAAEPPTGAPSTVMTQTLNEDDSYSTSVTFYDGMLQQRQTQSDTAADDTTGRVITDTFYDSHGWPVRTYAPYWDATTAPSTTMAEPDAENQIPSETVTTYDGQGRATQDELYSMGTAQWGSSTSYPGADETVNTPPAGGPTTQTITNALGQTTSTVVEDTANPVKLTPGQLIPSGTSLTSDSVQLTMQADGNLVLYPLAAGSSSSTALWSTGTSTPGSYAEFGTDGNLEVYSPTGTQLWSSGLAASTGTVLQIQNDADMAIDNSAGTPVWTSNTSGKASAANATTNYTYTPAGQVSSIADSAGNTWSYTYNLLGETLTQSDPNTGTTSFNSYDDLGNLLESTDPRGDKLGYTYDWDNRPTAEYNLTATSTESAGNELASWSYDTLAKGYPTSSTSYVGGASSTGAAYTQAVTGYNSAYQPTGTSTTIPAADGFAPAGSTVAPASGTVTYTGTSTYTPNTGELEQVHYDADGGLPDEAVSYTDYLGGMLEDSGSTLTYANGTHGSAAYLDVADYTALGQEIRSTYGLYGTQLVTNAGWDAATGRQLTATTNTQTSATNAVDSYAYRYDQAGDLTAVSDTESNGGAITGTDTQCFTYDSMQRLTQAWTDSQGLTALPSSQVGGVGGCNTATPEPSTIAAAGNTGGSGPSPAPYWQTYSYDLLGDRTSTVNHDTTGNAADNTTQTITYPGANGTAPATDPNQAATVTTANPSEGSTTTLTPGYTDTNGSNDGNTTSRAVTASGDLLSGVKTTAGGKLCLADPGASTTSGTAVILWGCGAGGQTASIGTDGTVRIQGLCLDTSGGSTANDATVVLDTCASGSASQQWKATATALVNTHSGRCLADPGANQTQGAAKQIIWTCGSGGQTYTTPTDNTAIATGQTQMLTYNPQGLTASVTTPSGSSSQTSSYIYDASGNLLEQTSSTGATAQTRVLYLFGGTEQITLSVPNKSWTALRTYAGPDGTVITRTSAGDVQYQIANSQGTAETAIDASSLAITRRYYDPYGNPRGTQPTTWISTDENHGFLGQPTDTSSGLDLLDARNYDPVTGRFLSPDPIFEAGDPNQMGGYTYAADNPSTGSDPTGQITLTHTNGYGGDGGGSETVTQEEQQDTTTSSGGTDASASDNIAAGFAVGINNAYGQINRVLNIGCWAGWQNCNSYQQQDRNWEKSEGIDPNNPDFEGMRNAADLAALMLAGDGLGKIFGGDGSAEPVDAPPAPAAGLTSAEIAADTLAASSDASEDTMLGGAGRPGTVEDPVQAAGNSEAIVTKPSDPATGTPGTGDEGGGSTGPRCSFAPTTPVLLANGKTKPIGKLKVGDKVESANPNTGKEEGARTVQHIWINHDTDLLDVTVSTGHGHAAVLHTTSNHPFWDDTTHTWVAAGKLHLGDRLASTGGQHPVVAALKVTPGAANRWNLTVQQLHTYYVLAGTTPILVHNSDRSDPEAVCSIGNYAVQSIASPSKSQTFSAAIRRQIDDLGYTFGCHTCGILDPASRGGRFVPDHQPISSWVPDGYPQRLYPQCLTCSRQQAGWARQLAPIMRQIYDQMGQ